MTAFTTRRTTPDEARIACDVMRTALLAGPINDDDWATSEDSWLDQDSFSAWELDTCIGHVAGYRFDLLVPGGAWVPTCGVTRVGVLPTHRRRGVISALLGELADDARDRGQVLAALRSSEATIYGRFGYGIASHRLTTRIDTGRARRAAIAPAGTFRLLAPDELLDVVPALYGRCAQRPGALRRPDWMWRRFLEEAIEGHSSDRVVVHTSPDGVDDGYAQYSVSWKDEDGLMETGTGEVAEVRAATPHVEAALWDYLLGLDLIRSLDVTEAPTDDLLFQIAADPRAVELRARYDELWLRILDVDAALRARSFNPSVPVAIGVTDDRHPDNRGTWAVGPDGTERTDLSAEITTDIAGLSAAYLGSTSWWELAASGRAAGTPDAVRRADTLFSHRPLAFCGSLF